MATNPRLEEERGVAEELGRGAWLGLSNVFRSRHQQCVCQQRLVVVGRDDVGMRGSSRGDGEPDGDANLIIVLFVHRTLDSQEFVSSSAMRYHEPDGDWACR